MNNLKIKIITGFRKDQAHSISAEEAHKAYYLFLNPEQRGVFENGLALRGQDIQMIEPDYHGTMGWNPSHNMDEYDWTEIRTKGIDKKIQEVLQVAQNTARQENPQLNSKLSALMLE